MGDKRGESIDVAIGRRKDKMNVKEKLRRAAWIRTEVRAGRGEGEVGAEVF
jgi:hypothetical protein